MPKKIAVIDGNSLMHRAYHAVPQTMNAPDGRPTNAVFGFMAMLLKFIDIAAPDALICAFDAGRPEFRMKAIEQYKAQRPPMDDDLKVQFPIIEELLEAMAIPVVRIKGWEGDDVLGTIAARNEELGYETLLVTGDKDAYQLASDLTRIVTTKKGITDVAIYGPEEVKERYGITPAQVPDYLGLKGDASDNIPGVPGIGEKTAAKLLQAYGNLEGLYEHTDELKGRQKERIEENKDAAFASREVATIVRDVEFPLDLEACSFPSFDAEVVTEAFSKVQFNSHLSRVLKLVGRELEKKPAQLSWEPVVHGSEAKALLEAAMGRDETVGVAFAEPEQVSLFNPSLSCVVSTSEGTALFEDEEGLATFARIVREGSFATFDVKQALHRIYPADTTEPALVDDADVVNVRAFDLGLAGYVLNSSVTEYTYDALLDVYCGGVLPETKTERDLAVVQAAAAYTLVGALTEAIERDGSHRAYFDIDLPLVGVLAVMERTGTALDCERLAELGESTQAELDELKVRVIELAGEEFNLDSPKQLSHILFEVLGLKPLKKNQRGYSTDAGVLKELATTHELPALVLRYRELAKIKSTYIDALPRMRAEDGRVHTCFNETVTTTGRLSSSDPNLQNIPVRTEFGRQIRECFVPIEPGHKFLSADYSQIELRLLAHLSGDEHLVAAFCSGADFHAATASRVFGIPVEDVTPELRSRAKAVNFGIVYGQQAFGLSQSLGIPFSEAKEMIDRYFAAYPGVRAYLDDTIEQAKEKGYAETMFGRKRHIPELRAGNANQRGFGERTAMNHPMQGSAADVIKLAMAEVQRRLMAEGFKARLLLQVHDELDFSVPEEEIEPLSAMVKEVMENIVELRVPLDVDVSYGSTWAESH
ncbi:MULTISPECIES: DNA polymerase I [Gordonibacter]|uniref:DNA polymerase I n=1 Tax=Gordonibacter faecis TaxID=3047475 RepID=A0ABT7DNN2_9ACTN|nr:MULTISPECIES: DNA polymerase I [unclassified Gordonibacter]MDJ1651133.1 DNA polymerase I [Gordonibacter sp. KGMB12511]HIW76574.1 DNA polymerase I [Candidatus Gordonibacter avicola]